MNFDETNCNKDIRGGNNTCVQQKSKQIRKMKII